MRQPGRVEIASLHGRGDRQVSRGARSVIWVGCGWLVRWPALGALPRCCRHVQVSNSLEIAKDLRASLPALKESPPKPENLDFNIPQISLDRNHPTLGLRVLSSLAEVDGLLKKV